jgi:hypothetical protein
MVFGEQYQHPLLGKMDMFFVVMLFGKIRLLFSLPML